MDSDDDKFVDGDCASEDVEDLLEDQDMEEGVDYSEVGEVI